MVADSRLHPLAVLYILVYRDYFLSSDFVLAHKYVKRGSRSHAIDGDDPFGKENYGDISKFTSPKSVVSNYSEYSFQPPSCFKFNY